MSWLKAFAPKNMYSCESMRSGTILFFKIGVVAMILDKQKKCVRLCLVVLLMHWCDGLTYEGSNVWNVPASDIWVAVFLVRKHKSHVSNLGDIPIFNRPKKQIILSMCKKKIHRMVVVSKRVLKEKQMKPYNKILQHRTSTDDDNAFTSASAS